VNESIREIQLEDEMRRVAGLFVSAFAMLASQPAVCVEVDPGDYTALPDGVNALVVYGQYAKRDAIYVDGVKAAGDPSLNSSVGILRMLHVVRLSERWTVDPQFLLPFGRLKAGGDVAVLGSESGVADLILATAFKYKVDAKAGETLGFTTFFWLPTGNYDAAKVLNLGENRWKAALQAGYTRPLATSWRWDLIGDVQLHGDNDKCAAACGSASNLRLEQKPLYHLQTHLRYEATPSLTLAASYGHIAGGATTVNGVEQSNRQRTDYLRLSAAYFVTPTTQLMTALGRDVHQENGFRENFRLNLRLFTIF
jgi:hypothetical protein